MVLPRPLWILFYVYLGCDDDWVPIFGYTSPFMFLTSCIDCCDRRLLVRMSEMQLAAPVITGISFHFLSVNHGTLSERPGTWRKILDSVDLFPSSYYVKRLLRYLGFSCTKNIEYIFYIVESCRHAIFAKCMGVMSCHLLRANLTRILCLIMQKRPAHHSLSRG